MPKKAFLFPGQGSQKVGMGKDLYDQYPVARYLYERAEEILGFSIADLCFDGPADELNKTNYSQLAILVTSLATLAVCQEKPDYQEPDAAAGLSLGEYSALVAMEALSFDAAVHIVERRGAFMQEACEITPSGMTSLIGLDKSIAQEICAAVDGIVVVANLNSPGQVVISGENTAVAEASVRAKERGARRALPLKVAGAFHSPLMEPAEQKLRQELATIDIKTPRGPVVSNVTADYVQMPDEIKDCLARQVTHAVLWEDSMRRLVADGYCQFAEIGPSKVLAGLLKRIEPSIKCSQCL